MALHKSIAVLSSRQRLATLSQSRPQIEHPERSSTVCTNLTWQVAQWSKVKQAPQYFPVSRRKRGLTEPDGSEIVSVAALGKEGVYKPVA